MVGTVGPSTCSGEIRLQTASRILGLRHFETRQRWYNVTLTGLSLTAQARCHAQRFYFGQNFSLRSCWNGTLLPHPSHASSRSTWGIKGRRKNTSDQSHPSPYVMQSVYYRVFTTSNTRIAGYPFTALQITYHATRCEKVRYGRTLDAQR